MSASHEGFARPLPVKSSEERIKEIQTGIVSEIKGNKSTGRSWQFNAPVVGKQIHQVVGRKTYHNYIIGDIHLHSHVTTCTNPRVSSGERHDLLPPASNTTSDTAVAVKAKVIQSSSPQLITVFSNEDGNSHTVCASICAEVETNWISGRIVRRLSLKVRRDELLKQADYGGKRLTSTGKAVDFVCSQGPSNGACRHRFYVVEHVPFDLLFGAELS